MKLNKIKAIKEKKPGKGFRIRYHILMSYLLLVVLSLALLWGTQILFLNKFYENERVGIAEKATDTMSEYFNQYDEITEENLNELIDA